MENTVEMMNQTQVQDDAALTVTEGASTGAGETLADVLGNDGETAKRDAQPAAQQPEAQKPEAGWIRRRIEDGVKKATADIESRLRAEYDAKLQPLREAAIERQADQLVADGEFKTRERAVEYLRLKGGLPLQQDPEVERAARRDAQGRFAAHDEPPAQVAEKAQALFAQARTIRAINGVDVMEIYNTDPDVKQRVLSGEWDFVDVLKNMGGQAARAADAPAPVRTSNGVALGNMDIRRMSPTQFEKMDELLAQGGSIDMRR